MGSERKDMKGKDVAVGDILDTIAGQVEVIGFAAHSGLDGQAARVAEYRHFADKETTGSITVFDDDDFVETWGVLIPRHLWHLM